MTCLGGCPPTQTCARDGPFAGTCVPAAELTYYPGPPLDELPVCMRAALERSASGRQTAADDALMGALASADAGAYCSGERIVPFCQQHAYKNTAYCACQNSGVPNPECIFKPCGNQYAYKTTTQREVKLNASAKCPQQVNCQNILSVGGAQNITEGIALNCQSTDEPAAGAPASGREATALAWLGANWVLVLIAVLLVAAMLPAGPQQPGVPNFEL